MRIAVTGSIAADHLMVFPGRFADQLVPDQLHAVSLSFLVDALEIRRGGVGPNICLGLSRLGLAPVLVGAAGADFEPYGAWLEERGVDTRGVLVSQTLHTARFVCTTDNDHNQIASFYAGAMAEARNISLEQVAAHVGGIDLVLVGADDPEGMVRHAKACRALGLPFAADPSQQLARLDRQQIRDLIDGARYLFCNEYERELLCNHSGWSADEVLERVETWITTLGAEGARVDRSGQPQVRVPAVPVDAVVDPTGGGDAFRAGFLAAAARDLGLESAARLGCMMGALAVETLGTQDYTVDAADVLRRYTGAYGPEAAAVVAPLVVGADAPDFAAAS